MIFLVIVLLLIYPNWLDAVKGFYFLLKAIYTWNDGSHPA